MTPTRVEHVVVLNDFCYVQGGASKVAIDEAVALSEQGVDVTFLGAVGPACDALRDAGVHVVCLGQSELADVMRHPSVAFRSVSNRAADTALKEILGSLDTRRCIVHLHGYTKALSAAPALAAKRAGFSTVCTLHDFFAACPNGAFYNYREQQPCTLTALSPACVTTNCDKRQALHKAYRTVRGMAQRHYARFPSSVRDYITLSRRSAELLAPYLPQDAAFYPLENIIDAPTLPAIDVAANRNLFVVGRLDEEKGVDLAATAAQQAGWPIVFVGDGPLKARLKATGATVTGWLPADQVWRNLEGARCLLFPSRWYETYGLVVSEAAARGIPSIVSDISAAAERVKDGSTGWIFRSGEVSELVDRLAVLRDDATVRAAGLAAYRAFWASPPDRQRHTNGLFAIYANVLARNGEA